MAKLRFTILIGCSLVILLFTCATLLAAQNGPDESGKSLGLVASKEANSKDVGLPMYPGAKLAQKDADGDPTAQFGLWVGGTGMKLVLMKLESADSPDKIATFYRTALSRYGKVLDCSGRKASEAQKHDSESKELTCEDEHDVDGILLKAGTKEDQHIVGVKEKAGRRVIQLVYVVARDEDNKI